MRCFRDICNLYENRLSFLIVLISFIFLINSCGIVVSKLIPFDNLPSPSGKYDVGTQVFTWIDSTRMEWFTENATDYRKIVVQAWYPAINISGVPTSYIDQWENRIGPIAEQIDMPKILIRSIKDVQSNSYLNADFKYRETPYPVVIFSHGLGGMRMQNTIQMETLASEGYIAIAIDHAYDANITLFDDGSIAEYRSGAEGELTVEEFWNLRIPQVNTRSADVSYVLDHIESLKKKKKSFWQLINLARIGIMGHSFGGTTAIVASSKDERLDACIILDGWLVPVESSIIQLGMDIPFLFIGREKWETSLNYLKLDSLIAASASSAEKLILVGTRHFDYSDTPQFTPLARKVGVAGKMPANAIRDTLNTRMLTFFKRYLIDEHVNN